ncbi:hypothetical protein M422DRAFT_248127 [Sphaerobolus stellatus SS14]|uniref:Uncharacterized protein n=1 Tax=Sphaerobolus stellatus (strain SS14) TaxID=990650 RepID=A0A0C9W5Y8_SPHS4|nr:hypothetical protein M422DRAFT_248127 [Sphaerobolus stellatus SS14]
MGALVEAPAKEGNLAIKGSVSPQKVRYSRDYTLAETIGTPKLRIQPYFPLPERMHADSLDDMRASRNPDVVRAWLDEKVSQGFDQKAIKSLLRMTSEELSEITPDSETVPYSIKINAMDIYNAIRRKGDIDTRLAPELDDSVARWLEKFSADGWSTLKEATPGEENRGGFTLAAYSPWQKNVHGVLGAGPRSSSLSFNSSSCQDLLALALTSKDCCRAVIPKHLETRVERTDIRRRTRTVWKFFAQNAVAASRVHSLEIASDSRTLREEIIPTGLLGAGGKVLISAQNSLRKPRLFKTGDQVI